MKVGQSNYNPLTGALNAAGRPDYEGQMVTFISPSGARCFDVAEKDKHGILIWVALPTDHPLYNNT